MEQRMRNARTTAPFDLSIDSLTYDGRGVGRHKGRVVFVSNALPGDTVTVNVVKHKTSLWEAEIDRIIAPSPQRKRPKCPKYGQCGGCSLQHMNHSGRLAVYTDLILRSLKRFAAVEPESVMTPLQSPSWGYRHRARLSVRWLNRKLLLGFRAAGSHAIIPISACSVLAPELEALLPGLAATLQTMSDPRAISHIELAAGDHCRGILLRTMKSLSEQDQDRWRLLAQGDAAHLWFEPSEPDQRVCAYSPDEYESLTYQLPEFDVKLAFLPIDFIQINPYINRQMVSQSVEWLDITATDTVLDLFCGLGNFTLPLATRAQQVVGVEGLVSLVEKGRENARINGLNNATFMRADLSQEIMLQTWSQKSYDACLLNPPRTGARDVLEVLADRLPDRLLYISCNPATLARDAGILKQVGYRLTRLSVMDMFPQTVHVETMALFLRN
ncbi:MAG: 23S rRNA (uracil(1939)-C(5))-methyltransferase RlmD [Endozoicomonadaceae bacterium]|nr:23S rRNA (uracil(1939)-C(5))-methyltransferase RlmD [Endozoicomonadaceae bacterium]